MFLCVCVCVCVLCVCVCVCVCVWVCVEVQGCRQWCLWCRNLDSLQTSSTAADCRCGCPASDDLFPHCYLPPMKVTPAGRSPHSFTVFERDLTSLWVPAPQSLVSIVPFVCPTAHVAVVDRGHKCTGWFGAVNIPDWKLSIHRAFSLMFAAADCPPALHKWTNGLYLFIRLAVFSKSTCICSITWGISWSPVCSMTVVQT